MLTCHYLISGQVQGVGYRAFTQSAARSLGLKGWVRNLQDGRVEIFANGPLERLAEFEKLLREGPRHANVDALITKNVNEPISETDFTLRPDGEKPR